MWANGIRAGGVVPLSSILSHCPLAPVIDGACDSVINSTNSYAKISSFYINAFASKSDYVRLQ
jgi:hypothetical protein